MHLPCDTSDLIFRSWGGGRLMPGVRLLRLTNKLFPCELFDI